MIFCCSLSKWWGTDVWDNCVNDNCVTVCLVQEQTMCRLRVLKRTHAMLFQGYCCYLIPHGNSIKLLHNDRWSELHNDRRSERCRMWDIEFLMIIWSKNVVHVSKSDFPWYSIEKVNFRSSSRSVKSLRDWLQKNRVNLKGFLLVVREKRSKWKRCNFFTYVRRFRIQILSMFTFVVRNESSSAF